MRDNYHLRCSLCGRFTKEINAVNMIGEYNESWKECAHCMSDADFKTYFPSRQARQEPNIERERVMDKMIQTLGPQGQPVVSEEKHLPKHELVGVFEQVKEMLHASNLDYSAVETIQKFLIEDLETPHAPQTANLAVVIFAILTRHTGKKAT